MTPKDLQLLYKQDTGDDFPHPDTYDLDHPDVVKYIAWLEENLILMTGCVDDLTTAIKKCTIAMNRTNPLIG